MGVRGQVAQAYDPREPTVLALAAKGFGSRAICERTGMSSAVVEKILWLNSNLQDQSARDGIERGTIKLGNLVEEAKAFSARYLEVREVSVTVRKPVSSRSRAPALPPIPRLPGDARPLAQTRDPCLRCGTRGELGCSHQAPFEARPAERAS